MVTVTVMDTDIIMTIMITVRIIKQLKNWRLKTSRKHITNVVIHMMIKNTSMNISILTDINILVNTSMNIIIPKTTNMSTKKVTVMITSTQIIMHMILKILVR